MLPKHVRKATADMAQATAFLRVLTDPDPKLLPHPRIVPMDGANW